MHKKLLILALLIAHYSGWCQIAFEPIWPPLPASQLRPPFVGVSASSIAFADVDGDQDQDVLITGSKTITVAENGNEVVFDPTAHLYINEGNGQYRMVDDTPFEGVCYSSVDFADVDGDQDLDLLITGRDSLDNSTAILYTNDGKGGFTEVNTTPFVGVKEGAMAFADVDGDTDQDVLITGQNSASDPVAYLYINDGKGDFTQADNTPFAGVYRSAIDFADVDGDQDQDVLIVGNNGSENVAHLYINNGQGVFTKQDNTPFTEVQDAAIAFSDIDGDQDQDVLITGYTGVDDVTALYANDGQGGFVRVDDIPFANVSLGSIAFADVDKDQDQDVLITGVGIEGLAAELYINNGNGSFSQADGTSFEGLAESSIAFADVDGDSDQDVLMTGWSDDAVESDLYLNDGKGNFDQVKKTPFVEVGYSSVAVADVDGDSDQDVLIAGLYIGDESSGITTLYTNDGTAGFTQVENTPFVGVAIGSVAFSDIDGDQDQDVLVTGSKFGSLVDVATLYTNDGTGSFTPVQNTPFTKVAYSSVAFADIDGDNDEDLLITGSLGANPVTRLYTNDGKGIFSVVSNTPFTRVRMGSVAFADVDGDNDQDVLISGQTPGDFPSTTLYMNDGEGTFSKMPNAPFAQIYNSSMAFADVDTDGDQDVLIAGQTASGAITQLYLNDGKGDFSEIDSAPFTKISKGSVAFADVEGDGDPDMLLSGQDTNGNPVTELYTNDGQGAFTKVADTSFVGVASSSVAFTDLDGNSTPDVLITGISEGGSISVAYRNITCQAAPIADVATLPTLTLDCATKTPPTAPTATDECQGKITGVADTAFPIIDPNVKEITWTYTNSKGISATQMQQVTVTSFAASVSTKGDSLIASPAGATYRWLSCENGQYTVIEGQTSQSFKANASGSYAVEVTSREGCMNTTDCQDMTVLGIVENTYGEDIQVYPNPTAGKVSIVLDKHYAQTEIAVRDLSGRLLQTQRLGYGQRVELNLPQPKGIYLVSLTSGKRKAVIRVVKQ